MSALNFERVKEIANDWHSLLGHMRTRSSARRMEWRLKLIHNLAALARIADDRSARLLFRVEYHLQT